MSKVVVNSYTANHKRVVRVRGRAAAHTCQCGAQADCWATIHGADPVDPASYQAMCDSCHLKYDGVGGSKPGRVLSEETKRKIGESNSKKTRPRELRARISDSVCSYFAGLTAEQVAAKHGRSAEHRAAQRERQLTAAMRECRCGVKTNAGTMSRHLKSRAARGETGHEIVT